MNRFALICLRNIAFFFITGLAIGFIWGFGNGLLVFLTLLAIWLIGHLWQIGQLITWLERPRPSSIPTGVGVWQQIFDTLLRQAKSRKRRKQKISQALQRFYHAFEVMPDGVMILDASGRIEWMNSVAKEHFLLKDDDLNGILANLVRQPAFHHFMSDACTANEVKLHLPTQKSTQRTVIVKRSDFDKNLQLLVSQDISRIEQLNQTRTDFIANVSHELRTPLTVINGFIETMQDLPNLPNDKREHFLGLMKKDSDRMLTLLDDLLTLTKLETKKDIDKFEPLNLSALVEQLSQEAQTLSDGKQTITTDIEPDLWIRGIHLDLYNALSNLAFNAVRYNQTNGHISISLQRTDDLQARFSVKDDGPGIAAEHLPRLTERFYRVDTGRSRASGGTGLGLAITKHALVEHQSQLEIDSTVGVGSEFSACFNLISEPRAVKLTGTTTATVCSEVNT